MIRNILIIAFHFATFLVACKLATLTLEHIDHGLGKWIAFGTVFWMWLRSLRLDND